jgi:AcrR family transcriptional regulator
MADTARTPTGLRALKRHQTQERLREAALQLFLAKGYAATTLDDIAAAAGISRRSIFSYVASKEEIVFQHIDRFLEALVAGIAAGRPNQPPLSLLKAGIIDFAGAIDANLAVETARFLHGADELNAGRLVRLRQIEIAIVEALRRVWPAPRHLPHLQAAAMMAVGALRLGMDQWVETDSAASLATCVQTAFEAVAHATETSLPPGNRRAGDSF